MDRGLAASRVEQTVPEHRVWAWLAQKHPAFFNFLYHLTPSSLRPHRKLSDETQRFRREYGAHMERKRQKLLRSIEADPNTALIRLPECLPNTFHILGPDATGSMAEMEEVAAAFASGVDEVVIVHG